MDTKKLIDELLIGGGVTGGSSSHRAGVCFEIGESLDMNIEGTRRPGSDGVDHGVMFRFRLKF